MPERFVCYIVTVGKNHEEFVCNHRRVSACLLKLFISCSANFRLSSSFVNSIMSSAYCKVLNSMLLYHSLIMISLLILGLCYSA